MEINRNYRYWKTEASEYHNELHAEKEVLHPYIAEIVNGLKAKNILDYGCGNGFLASLLSEEFEISLFDIGNEHLDAKQRWNLSESTLILKNLNEIKINYYDAIILSSVIMCIPTINELKKIFNYCHNFLNKSGELIISMTHPCFLQYDYGHYKTSFDHTTFDYLKEGMEYKVHMKRNNKSPIIFTDYNWPISTLINELLDCGFTLTNMIEHPDLDSKNFQKKDEGCPWMFITLKKQ